MKKFLEIEETTAIPTNASPPGLYFLNGYLYLVNNGALVTLGYYPQIQPFLLNNTNAGLDFRTICKFIAIGANVDNAKLFSEEKD